MRYLDVDGRRVSLIGLGCWQFGGREWGYGKEFDEADCAAIVRRAIALGVTLIDTAEMYGGGESERILGRTLRGDEDVFLATKYMPWMPLPWVLARHCSRSLSRLARAKVSLYQMHWPNPIVPLRVQMAGMRRVLDTGRVDHAGVSNYSLRRWRAADRVLGRPVLSNQVRYNLLQRNAERRLIPFAQRENRLVIAYSPLAQGALSGRYSAQNLPAGVRRVNGLFTPANLERARPLIDALRDVGGRHGLTPSQVALAYVIAQPRTVAIPGAKSIAQLEANVAAADVELSDTELSHLRGAADGFRRARVRSAPQFLSGLVARRR
jgi:aryl-alcohol dehydrogenase-like predicted oxidoreductase